MTDEEAASVSRLVRGYFGNQRIPPQAVDDAVQDVLLALLLRSGEIRSLTGYAIAVARNQRCAVLRLMIQERAKFFDIEAYRETHLHTNPHAEAEAEERLRLMHTLIATLPVLQRDLVSRFYLRGQSAAQICTELGIPRTKFEMEKSRATQRLADRVSARGKSRKKKPEETLCPTTPTDELFKKVIGSTCPVS